MRGDLLNKTKRAIKAIVKPVKIIGSVQANIPHERFGSEYGGWVVDPTRLSDKSIVYSVGVGENITFDLAIIQRFGCVVHAMDPTPKAIEFCRAQRLPDQFRLYEFGLAGKDGELTFYPPENANHVSHTILNRPQTAANAIRVPVLALSTILQRFRHTRIDLIKMDIEGAEYEVIDDIVSRQYDIDQLLVEFHHRFPQVGDARTVQAIDSLNSAGYKIFNISPSGEEYSFVCT